MHVLRVEGVNMTPTILDTQDLATLRGGSLALLMAPRRVETVLSALRETGDVDSHSEIFMGASQGAFSVTTAQPDKVRDIVAAALRGESVASVEAEPVYRHLRIVVDIAPVNHDGGGEDAALTETEALNRMRQMRELTVPYPGQPAHADLASVLKPCPVDGIRPVQAELNAPAGRWPDHEIEPNERAGSVRVGVSASVADRRAYSGLGSRTGGRADGRIEAFYRKDLGLPEEDIPRISNDFADLVEVQPPGLPESLRNKMAVIYVDGNKFGKLRAEYQRVAGVSRVEALGGFSTQLRDLRKGLAQHLAKFLRGRTAELSKRLATLGQAKEDQNLLRMETLLWGGDEARWVVPAWLAWDFMDEFFAYTGDWALEIPNSERKLPLTHAMGTLICSVKTPISQAIGLSHDLADIAKESCGAGIDGQRNYCQVEILESLDIPSGSLAGHRRALYGDGLGSADLTLSGAGWAEMTHRIIEIKAAFPRSQLYRLLRLAGADNALRLRTGDEEAATFQQRVEKIRCDLQDTLKAGGYAVPSSNEPLTPEHILKAPAPGAGARAPLLPLALLAQYWDYVDPMDLSPIHQTSRTGATHDAA